MKKLTALFFTLLFGVTSIIAQVAINTDGSAPDNSAMLDIKSTTKGVLLPRMSQEQIMNIDNPVNGLTAYNTDDNRFYFYDDGEGEWKEIAVSTGTITPWACGDAWIDTRDNKSYATVQIETQCWMAENLNIGTQIDGSTNQTNNSEIEKYCYDDNTSNCDIYGGLYLWSEMMEYSTIPGIQGVCPTSWHLPTDDEWKILEMQLGMSQAQADATGLRGTDEGGKLKETGTTHWTSPNTGATNLSGFTGLPSGYHYNNSFVLLPGYGYFWTSSRSYLPWYRMIQYNSSQLARQQTSSIGFSVRCLKD